MRKSVNWEFFYGTENTYGGVIFVFINDAFTRNVDLVVIFNSCSRNFQEQKNVDFS